MSTPASPARGYTLGLAGRHVVAGFLAPRTGMREALTAGLGLRAQIVLYATAVLFLIAPYKGVRDGFLRAIATIGQSSGPAAQAYNVCLLIAIMASAIAIIFLIGCASLYVSALIFRRERCSFYTARSVVAFTSWILIVPVAALNAPAALLGAPVTQIATAAALTAVMAVYAVLCVAEAYAVSISRSTLIVLVAAIGNMAVHGAANLGLAHLVAYAHNLRLEADPA